jgi:hypothetical protein
MKSECENQNRSLKSLECSVSLLGSEFERKISESLSPVTGLHGIVQLLQTDMNAAKEKLSHVGFEFPLKAPKSDDGLISYLTRKHAGNVHDKGIVTITSKSIVLGALQNAADLTSDSNFLSKNEPGQWVCWDFREMRLRLTHYTLGSYLLKSWVVESSLDGEAWTEIDRKTDNVDFKDGWGKTASFAVSKSAECRFIRLTQTGKRHCGDDFLQIYAFEVFGTLLE